MRPLLLLLTALALVAAEPALPGIVYVPYDKADGIAIDSNGVMLPYEHFVKLWDAAHPGTDPHKPPPPPVAAALTEFTMRGQVTGDIATLHVEATAIAVAEGWSSIRLPANLAPTRFSATDARVVIERRDDGLLVHLPAPGTYALVAELAVAVHKDAAGRRSLVLTPPTAAAGRLDLRIDDGEVDVSLTPAIAVNVTRAAGSTQVQAVVGGSGELAIAWQPPARAVAGQALVLSDTVTRLRIGERSLRYDQTLNVTILRRPVQELEVALPAQTQVLAVDATNLRTWERVGDTLKLVLHQGVEGAWQATIRLETLLEAQNSGSTRSLDIAWPHLLGAARSLGVVTIEPEEGLALAVTAHEHLAQTDPSQLGLEAGATAYRHLIAPPPSKLDVTRLESEIRGSLVQFTHLSADEDHITVILDLEVRRAGVFSVGLTIPESWETVSVEGLAVDDIRPGSAQDGRRRLDLALRSRLLGAGSLRLEFRAPPSIPREAGASDLAIGIAELPGARHLRGSLGIAAPRSWALSAGDRHLLTGADAEALRRSTPLAVRLRALPAGDDVALAFAWLSRADETQRLRLNAAPRARELLLRQEERIVLGDSGVHRRITWQGDVRFSPLTTLRIRAPSDLRERLSFSGNGLADQRVIGDADGQTVWELRFQTPVMGSFTFSAEIRDPLPDLEPGKAKAHSIAAISPEGATRLDTLVAIAREGTVDVVASSNTLERIPAADLPPALQSAGLVTGFRGGNPGPIALEVTRHDLVRLADASISLAHYAAALGDDGMLRVLGRLTLRSRGRPWLALHLGQGADLLEVAVDGRTARPSRRADGAIIIPLGEQAGETRIIGFVYEQKVLDGKAGALGRMHMELPRIASRGDAESAPLPVERVEVSLHLDADLTVTAWSGDLSPLSPALSVWEQVMQAVVPPQAGGHTTHGPVQRDGLTVPVLLDGTRHTLARLGDGGVITLHWWRRSWIDALALLGAACALAATWALRRRPLPLSALCVVAVIMMAGTAAPWRVVALACAGGVGLGLVVLASAALWQRLQRPRSVPAPDPVSSDPWQVAAGTDETSP